MKNSAPFYPINTEIIEWWGKTIRSVGAPFDFGVESRFDYEYIIDGKVSGGGYINRHRRTMFSRIDLFDQMVRDNTKMGIKEHTSELEKRVLNAIDIFWLSDDAIALEIRFLLSVIALEGLLLSEGDKDYLGWKLSEKVAFLVADTRKWRVAQERYGRPHTN